MSHLGTPLLRRTRWGLFSLTTLHILHHILLLEDIDSCILVSLSVFGTCCQKGEKIQLLVCGSFGFLLDYFCFGHCCGLYPLTIVWNKTVGLLFKVIWWSSGHHLLSYQFVMITSLWSKNDVYLEIVMCITTPVMTLLHPSDGCIQYGFCHYL